MKIAHINTIFNLRGMKGVVRKLGQQAQSFKEHGCDVYVISPNKTDRAISKELISDNFFFKNQWLNKSLKFISVFNLMKSKNYDALIIRYTRIDPSALLLYFLDKKVRIYFEFHSSIEDEIKNEKLSSFFIALEKILFKIIHPIVCGSISTSYSIKEKNKIFFDLNKKHNLVLENHVDISSYPTLPFKANNIFNSQSIKFVMIASKFQYWHGLDIAIDLIKKLDGYHTLHIIGDTSNFDNLLTKVNQEGFLHVNHGVKSWEDSIKIMSKCDVGIDSLGISRLNLSDISTLKIKEYILLGLTVISATKNYSLRNFREKIIYVDLKKLNFKNIKKSIISSRKKIYKDFSQLDWGPAVSKLIKEIRAEY